ncbi:hypothetical protein C8R47DRAFT_595968 [Mycena vitilis]|nr:hypothetical protein C8R47DRAFT_595968 [Mycena vitilis]
MGGAGQRSMFNTYPFSPRARARCCACFSFGCGVSCATARVPSRGAWCLSATSPVCVPCSGNSLLAGPVGARAGARVKRARIILCSGHNTVVCTHAVCPVNIYDLPKSQRNRAKNAPSIEERIYRPQAMYRSIRPIMSARPQEFGKQRYISSTLSTTTSSHLLATPVGV